MSLFPLPKHATSRFLNKRVREFHYWLNVWGFVPFRCHIFSFVIRFGRGTVSPQNVNQVFPDASGVLVLPI